MHHSAQATQTTISKWDYIQPKTSRAKETVNRVQRQPMELEKITKRVTLQSK
jgi:hypothetical protein